jgi:hypothetical protein
MDIRSFFGVPAAGGKAPPPAAAARPEEESEAEAEAEFDSPSPSPSKAPAPASSPAHIVETKEAVATKLASPAAVSKVGASFFKKDAATVTKKEATPAAKKEAKKEAKPVAISKESASELKTQPDAPSDTASTELPSDLTEIIDWEPGTSVPYKAVADAFEKIGATTGRLEKESILCRLLCHHLLACFFISICCSMYVYILTIYVYIRIYYADYFEQLS